MFLREMVLNSYSDIIKQTLKLNLVLHKQNTNKKMNLIDLHMQ